MTETLRRGYPGMKVPLPFLVTGMQKDAIPLPYTVRWKYRLYDTPNGHMLTSSPSSNQGWKGKDLNLQGHIHTCNENGPRELKAFPVS